VAAPDLAELYRTPGPFVSAYLTTDGAIENASFRSEQRWKSLRDELADAGAPDAALAAVDPLVAEAHLHGGTLAAVGDADGLLLVEHGPEPPARDRGEVGPLPALLPILAWRQAHPPHLTVLADRSGADLTLSRLGRDELTGEAGGVTGPMARTKPGGWSQRRFQQRAENSWDRNADDVAADLTALVDRFGPRLVVLAGDVRAVEMIEKALPERVGERLVVVEGSRADDGDERHVAARVAEQVAAAVNLDVVRMLEKFREELGQADRAAEGPVDTLAALARAQVEVLLVAGHLDGHDGGRHAWFGPEPHQVAGDPDTVRAMGVERPQEGRLADVAVRAALATGASVAVVGGGDLPAGGLGAILRWA
jgi:hypothetical protein